MTERKNVKSAAEFLQKHRFSLFFFLFLALYHALFVKRLSPWVVDDVTFSFHAVDFSFGFATKLLPGAVFNALFGSHASRTAASVFNTVLMLLFFFGVSVFLEKMVLQTPQAQRRPLLILLFFYLSGAYTFSIFTDELGMLDSYWLFFSLFFFCFLEHKVLRYLIPLLFALSIMIHYSALLNYIVLFAVVLLYRASVAKERRERRAYLLIFSVSCVVTVAAFLFFVLAETRTLCSMEEFHQKLEEHGSSFFLYYDYAFYDQFSGEVFLPAEVAGIGNGLQRLLLTMFYRICFNFKLAGSIGVLVPVALFGGLALLAPILCVFYRFLVHCFRETHDSLGRFSFFLMLVQFPLTLTVAMLFSVDSNRWLTHCFLILFTLILTVLYYDKEHREFLFEQMNQYAGNLETAIYFLGYATIHFWAYF